MNKFILLFIFSLELLFSFLNLKNDADQKTIEEFKNKNYSSAINYYEKLLETKKESPLVYYNLGTSYLANGEYQKAILNLERAEERAERLKNKIIQKDLAFNLYANLGKSYYLSEKYLLAIENYKKALKINYQDLFLKKSLELAIKKLEEKRINQNKKNNVPNNPGSENNNNPQQINKENNSSVKNDPLKGDPAKNKKPVDNPPKDSPKNQAKNTKENLDAILEAFNNNQDDNIVKQFYRQNRSNKKNDKNW